MSEHYSGNDPARGCGLLLIFASAVIVIGGIAVAILVTIGG